MVGSGGGLRKYNAKTGLQTLLQQNDPIPFLSTRTFQSFQSPKINSKGQLAYVQTHAAESYETHPFREYFDRGLNVVLNTDNRLMSGVTLTDEYVHAAESLGFTFDELSRVALNGFESCFLPYDQRMRLVVAAEREIAALRSAAA